MAPGAQPPQAVVSRGKTVCTCFNVCEPDIVIALQRCEGSAQERLAQVQTQLKCGTNCGSCVPQLQRMIKTVPLASLAAHGIST